MLFFKWRVIHALELRQEHRPEQLKIMEQLCESARDAMRQTQSTIRDSAEDGADLRRSGRVHEADLLDYATHYADELVDRDIDDFASKMDDIFGVPIGMSGQQDFAQTFFEQWHSIPSDQEYANGQRTHPA